MFVYIEMLLCRGSAQSPQWTTFSALCLFCDVPGCNRPFKNWSGLTQHKRCHLCLNHSRRSPGHSEQVHSSSAIPPVTEHIADHDGLQDDGPHDFNHSATSDQELDGMITEFIGPGNKVYRNYHAGLNGKPTHTPFYFYSYILLQHEDVTPRAIFYQMMLCCCTVYRDHQMTGPHTATG